MTKVIHVHLLYEKKNYYFGSLSAIFDVLSEAEVGITKSSLLHAGMTDGSCKITKRAMIIQSHLIRAAKYLFYLCLSRIQTTDPIMAGFKPV